MENELLDKECGQSKDIAQSKRGRVRNILRDTAWPRRGVGRYETEGNAAYLSPAMQSHAELSPAGGASLSGLQILVVGNTRQSGGMLQQPGQN